MASYEKRGSSGLWSVRFRVLNDDGSFSNKRLSGYKTKKEAQYAYEDYLKTEHLRKEQEKRIVKDDIMLTPFKTIYSKYFEFKKGRLKDSSYYDLASKLDARILPFFENYKMREITPVVILEWQNTLKDYSFTYQNSLFAALSGIYLFAEKYYDIPNVMMKIDRPRNLEPKKEMQIYTPEEFEKMIQCVDKYPLVMYFKFLYYTACRRGEALALNWNDIDLNTGIVSISKNVTRKGSNTPGKSYHITTPKNVGSNRKISLPHFFVDELKAYKKWQKKNYSEINFVFCGADPLTPKMIERSLNKASEKAGIKRIRVHDLRHSAASFLIHKGISIVAVSRRLGHSSTEETLNTYSHLLPDDQKMILGVLDTLNQDK